AVADADAVLILTEWTSFADLNWKELAPLMRKPAWLFDARSIADLDAARSAGLQVWRVGCG
ncbi:MAG: UDP binding domain-containing protein, partial [Vulcanococcus sp.]